MACSSFITNEEIKRRILNHFAKFVSDAEPDRLSDWLVQGNVISIDQSQRIRSENSTNPDRCRALLHHLFSTQHPTAFLTVREALRERNHYLLQYIDSKDSRYDFGGQSNTRTFSQVVLAEEKNDEDQKSAWEDEKDRLLNMQKELETKIRVEDQNAEERSTREQTKIRTLEVKNEKLMQDLNSEKIKNKALQTEVEKLRQELDNETKSSESCQTDLDHLKQKVANEREHAKELEKMMTALQSWMSKLELKKAEGQEREQLIMRAQEKKKIFAEHRYRSNPVLVQGIGTRAAKEQNKVIRGFTILDKELFLVSSQSSEVEVFDRMKLSFSRRWNLMELVDPGDITSCSRNKCLYISDYKVTDQPKGILRVDPNGKLIRRWSTGDDHGFSLSVTDEANIILVVNDRNKLNEYSPDGQLIREINLSSVAGIRFTLWAKKLANGNFLVSHGRCAGEQHRVCIVDAEAKLKKSFGGEPGSSTGNMWDPVDLVIDGNGFVMVVDRNNSRVLLLDSDLRFKSEILSMERHGLGRPYGIVLDEANGRLFVGDSKLKPNSKLYNEAPIAIFDF